MRDLQDAAALSPDEPQVYYLLGEALRRLGRKVEAQQATARVAALRGGALHQEQSKVIGTQ